MLCKESRQELMSIAVGRDKVLEMNRFELEIHSEKLSKAMERAKAREPHKFWSDSDCRIRLQQASNRQKQRRLKERQERREKREEARVLLSLKGGW